jgi:hypothetical protein
MRQFETLTKNKKCDIISLPKYKLKKGETEYEKTKEKRRVNRENSKVDKK